MYEINKLLHGKRFVRDFHTRRFCIRNLTRSISDTSPTRVKIPYTRAFHEVISIYSVLNTHNLDTILQLKYMLTVMKPARIASSDWKSYKCYGL